MANEIFLDTSGWFAILARDDDQHAAAAKIIAMARKRRRGFVTTDYVLDETATLLKARRKPHLLATLFDRVEHSAVCRIEWTDSERFFEARAHFLKHADQAWSFTDCLSFTVMARCQLRDALTKDAHFRHAGFQMMLTSSDR
jgi:predicted nucleic acid-binding protein